MNESFLKYAVTADVTGTASPAFDLAAVRNRAAAGVTAARPGRSRSWLLAALVIGVPSLALAASQIIPARIIWLPHGGVFVSSKNAHVYRTATPGELAKIVQGAHYRVVPPLGLPAGSKLRGFLMAAGTESFVVSYSVPGQGQCCSISFLITPASAAPSAYATLPPGYSFKFVPKAQTRYAQWNAGAERVTVLGYSITSAQLSHIRNAMIAKGNAQAIP
jgi:hypothetical protein